MGEMTGTQVSEVVGRDDEISQIERFLDRGEWPRALLLEGEPGIGKTTLWRRSVAAAEQAGYTVLACRPAGAEVRLSFSALADLVGGELEAALPMLPEPQRRALAAALLFEDDGVKQPDQRAIAAGTLSALRSFARDRRVLVAIDDAQWLDAPSATVLEYALRRLRAETVAILVSSRTEASALAPLALDHALTAERLTRLEIGSLSLGALYRLLRERTGRSFSRPTLRRIHETTARQPLLRTRARAYARRRGRPHGGATASLGESGRAAWPPAGRLPRADRGRAPRCRGGLAADRRPRHGGARSSRGSDSRAGGRERSGPDRPRPDPIRPPAARLGGVRRGRRIAAAALPRTTRRRNGGPRGARSPPGAGRH